MVECEKLSCKLFGMSWIDVAVPSWPEKRIVKAKDLSAICSLRRDLLSALAVVGSLRLFVAKSGA
jgi:hypothetical protein